MRNKDLTVLDGLPPWIQVHPDVEQGLRTRQPVVALETTVVTHGLPKPYNFELGMRMQQEVRDRGAVPATIALIDGTDQIGLSDSQLERLASDDSAVKVNRRELAVQRVRQRTGGTTVAATMHLAHKVGIEVFATGGIGGIHRGSASDVSADLPELAGTPVAVVCSGAKAILDLPRTLEWLETFGVPVLGWMTDIFPEFFSAGGTLPVQVRAESASDAAALIQEHWRMGLHSGVLVCVPCPKADALPASLVEESLATALAQAQAKGVSGKEVSPFLLDALSELTAGATLQANTSLLRNNARMAADLAAAMASPKAG